MTAYNFENFLQNSAQDFRNFIHINSVALVRERTIPTERPPPVGEVSANFCGQRGVAWSAQRVPTAVKLCFLDLEPLHFYSSSSSIDLRRLTRLSRHRSRPTTTQKNLAVPGIEPGTSVSVARNSDHQTTEAVIILRNYRKITKCFLLFSLNSRMTSDYQKQHPTKPLD